MIDEKKLKKKTCFFCLVLMSIMILGGCKNSTSENTEDSTTENENILYVKEAPEDLTDDLKVIREKGILRVGIQNGDLPYFSKDPVSGELSGVDVDLAYEAAGRIFGCTPDEAKENDAVDIQLVNADSAGPLLYDEKIDLVIGEKTITDPFTEELNNREAVARESSESQGGDDETPDETAPEVFKEAWPEQFSDDDSQSDIPEIGSSDVDDADIDISELDALDPTPEPTQYWDFTGEYETGRVITVLPKNEGLSTQMNRMIKELVNSGKILKLNEKYENNDNEKQQ